MQGFIARRRRDAEKGLNSAISLRPCASPYLRAPAPRTLRAKPFRIFLLSQNISHGGRRGHGTSRTERRSCHQGSLPWYGPDFRVVNGFFLDKVYPVYTFQAMTALAKVFMSGNSQAIRLPRAFRIDSPVVRISRIPEGLLITDEETQRQRVRNFSALQGSCLDFPEIEPNTHSNLARELE